MNKNLYLDAKKGNIEIQEGDQESQVSRYTVKK